MAKNTATWQGFRLLARDGRLCQPPARRAARAFSHRCRVHRARNLLPEPGHRL